jgi:hypothetical protein
MRWDTKPDNRIRRTSFASTPAHKELLEYGSSETSASRQLKIGRQVAEMTTPTANSATYRDPKISIMTAVYPALD